MIKVYVMSSCPDCIAIKKQIENNDKFEEIDIGTHIRKLKEFMRLRDNNAAFDKAKAHGNVGIPCFVLENGEVTFASAEANLQKEITQVPEDATCNIDGTGC